MESSLPQMGLIFWTMFSILIVVLPIVSLFSLLKSTSKDSTTKLIWVLVIVLVPVVGSIFYYIIGKEQRIKVA